MGPLVRDVQEYRTNYRRRGGGGGVDVDPFWDI